MVDSSGSASHPSDEAVSGVRSAIGRYLIQDSTDAELRAALRDLARDAQTRSLRAEELIVALKRLLHSLPQVQRMDDRADRDGLVARLVSVCIDVYYERGATPE